MAPKDRIQALGQAVRDFVKKNPHVWLALYVPVYMIVFLAAEHHVVDNYYVSYMPLDDHIPFVEYFVIPYYLWYPFLVIPGLYLMLRDGYHFRRYMYFLMIGFTVSIAFCLLFPNGQDLRPAIFPRDNLFTRMVGAIYRVDTNTNVIPSMHVVGSVAVLCAVLHCPSIKSLTVKGFTVILTLLISASTVFIKQHSFLDIIAAAVLCVPIYLIVYGREIFQHFNNRLRQPFGKAGQAALHRPPKSGT